MKEIPILVKIVSGSTCGMSLISMDVPDGIELNQTMNQVINKDMISVEIKKVLCEHFKENNIVSFYCSIDDIKNSELILSYYVSNKHYEMLNEISNNNGNLKLANNKSFCIMKIKQVIDSYDPIINVN